MMAITWENLHVDIGTPNNTGQPFRLIIISGTGLWEFAAGSTHDQ